MAIHQDDLIPNFIMLLHKLSLPFFNINIIYINFFNVHFLVYFKAPFLVGFLNAQSTYTFLPYIPSDLFTPFIASYA